MHSFIYSTDFCLPHSTQNALAEIINAIYFPNPVDTLQLQLYRLPLLHLTVAMIFFLPELYCLSFCDIFITALTLLSWSP